MGEEAQPSVKASPSEDALMIRDVVSQTKDVKAKSKADDVHFEAIDPQKDPSQAKAYDPRYRTFFPHVISMSFTSVALSFELMRD